MSFWKKSFGRAEDSESELDGISIDDIEDIFVIAETEALTSRLAGKSQQEKMTAAVSMAYSLWNERSVRDWAQRKQKLVSLAGSGVPVDRIAALDCVRRNFDAQRYAAFAVRCARVRGLGNTALVLALSREPAGT